MYGTLHNGGDTIYLLQRDFTKICGMHVLPLRKEDMLISIHVLPISLHHVHGRPVASCIPTYRSGRATMFLSWWPAAISLSTHSPLPNIKQYQPIAVSAFPSLRSSVYQSKGLTLQIAEWFVKSCLPSEMLSMPFFVLSPVPSPWSAVGGEKSQPSSPSACVCERQWGWRWSRFSAVPREKGSLTSTVDGGRMLLLPACDCH